jgi:hypothetical protein
MGIPEQFTRSINASTNKKRSATSPLDLASVMFMIQMHVHCLSSIHTGKRVQGRDRKHFYKNIAIQKLLEQAKSHATGPCAMKRFPIEWFQ